MRGRLTCTCRLSACMVSPVRHMQEGRYAWVHEDGAKLSLVSGTPPSFLNCSRQGELPGCLFMFDQVDQQCADGRTGDHECSSSHISLSFSLSDMYCFVVVCHTPACMILSFLLLHEGFLCGSCPAGTAVSLDLQFCSDKCEMGIIVFIIMCKWS